MIKLVLMMAASLTMVGAAAAADLPRAQPAPAAGPIGKAPIGKFPVGKTPIGKTPVGKTPVAAPAPAPVVRKG
jgi:hypothetical protein